MIKEHATAVLALLDADNTAPALTVFDSIVPNLTDPALTPYVLVRFSEAAPELNFTRVSYVYGLRFVCYCVAGTDAAVRTVVDRVKTAVQDVTPTVTGRKCYPIRWDDSAEMSPQERTGTVVSSMIVGFVLRSVPA